MPGEVYGSPHYAWRDSARSWGSRVVRGGGGCRSQVVGRVNGAQSVEARRFRSPYVARPPQRCRRRPGTCAFPY